MRFFLFFVLLLFSKPIFGQVNPAVKKYAGLIQRAEIAILDSNFAKALAFYQEAFDVLPSPFAVDLRNAAVCSGFLNEHLWTFRFGQRLAKKGIALHLFKNEIFTNFRKTEYWENLQITFNEFSQNPTFSFSLSYRQKMEQLREAHRLNRLNEPAPDEYALQENSMYQQLITLLKQNGFPTEDKIGLEKGQADISTAIYIDVIVYQLQNGHLDLLDTLQKNVWNGNLHPRLAQTMLESAFFPLNRPTFFDKKNEAIYFGSHLFNIQNQYFISDFDTKNEQLIAQNRATWLLDPPTLYFRKITCQHTTCKYFSLGAKVPVFNFEDYSKQEQLMNFYQLKLFKF